MAGPFGNRPGARASPPRSRSVPERLQHHQAPPQACDLPQHLQQGAVLLHVLRRQLELLQRPRRFFGRSRFSPDLGVQEPQRLQDQAERVLASLVRGVLLQRVRRRPGGQEVQPRRRRAEAEQPLESMRSASGGGPRTATPPT